jgi:hypothetical protein
MPEKRFDLFTLLAFLPGSSFVLMWVYVQGFDGWGRWGAAPLLLVPVLLSVPITLAGALRVREERTRGSIRTATVVLTILAALPLLWFATRLARG